jgi:hypothetical protein
MFVGIFSYLPKLMDGVKQLEVHFWELMFPFFEQKVDVPRIKHGKREGDEQLFLILLEVNKDSYSKYYHCYYC